jgi:DNA invertase Pin-like site-specific DNA recombinase
MKDREWRAQMEAELVALRRRLAAVEAVLAGRLPRRPRAKGQAPFGWRRDETGGLVAVPEQQVAIRQMRRMQSRGLSLREIATAMKAGGMPISHMSVKNVLDAASADARAGLIEGRHVYVQDVPPRG